HALSTIGAQAYRIRDMIGDLMLFARPPAPKPEALELVEVIREVSDKFARELASTAIRLHVEAVPPAPIFADPVQLRVVISSLLRNSLEALGAEGAITIAARPVDESGRAQAFFSIADTGTGLSATDREHLFDPFYSGRQAGRGLGFGLSKSWRIVTLHGGRIDVASPEAGGVEFTVTWPAASTRPSGANRQTP